jgi:hypothetical protein
LVQSADLPHQGREKDGAVIHAIVTFGEFLHNPGSQEAAQTVKAFNQAFCQV